MRPLQATIALLLVSTGAGTVFAQDAKLEANWHFLDRATIPDASPAMPAHVRMLYTDEVDMRELERAYRAYYAGKDAGAPFEDLERDPWAKFFHQWYRGAEDFIDDEGIVRVMSTSELLAYRAEQASTEGYSGSESAAGASWSFLGPKRTLWRADHDAAQPTAPWQVNVYCIAVAPSNPSILYCGSETGCLYKSVDKGLEWTPFNEFNWSRAILSVAIHPSDPDVVYAGTSNDIYKTTDGGTSWSIVLTESGLSCNSLAISPSTPDTLFAGSANGLYRSVDAGANWTEVLTEHVDDVAFRPNDGSTVYALTRTGGPDTYSFYKSTDVGTTFSLSMSGWGTLYEHSGGRISVTPADPDYIYAALLTHDGSGGDTKPYILKSTDAAASWTSASVCNSGSCPLTNGQGYYDLAIVVSHDNPEHVIAATTTAYRSTNGGSSWSAVGGYTGPFSIHPDIQSMVSIMDGTTENTWIATDGGANFSTDFYANTANWEARIDGLDGTDFWGFAQGWNEDYLVGGRYHNGNTAIHENYPDKHALRLGGAESVTGWALHGRERHAAFDDISELIIPETIDGAPEGSFLFSKHPQNYYYGDAFSRVMVDVEDFMTVYLGEGQSFWRSIDGGGSWEATHTFSGKPYHFDISRADGDYIYLAADDGFYRSTDRGESFTEMSLPTGLTNWHSQNLRVAASSADRDTVWVLNHRATAPSSIGRIFISEDGGASWTDWTTSLVTGQKWLAMAHQAGTNGGVYIASKRGAAGVKPARVLYRDKSMSDWVDWSAGLPDSANPIKLLPFYKDGKLRWGGNRGAWEIDFYEQDWTPIAQPFVSGKTQICIRDVVELDSYSVADSSATYSWTVPGADWTSDLEEREVQATFPATGTFTATLTVTQGSQVDSKAVEIHVENHCDPDPSPGNAIALSGESSDWAATSRALDITTNTMTMSAWMKRDGQQEAYAGIVFMRQGTACGLNFRNHRILGFHWNNAQWGWDSGLIVPNNKWAHVAMVVTPSETMLYVNGVSAVNGANPVPCTFDGVMNFGADPDWAARRFKGEMDEVLIYDRALSQDEIRELMYLTRDPANETGLLGYWQFNRPEGVITDRVGTNHASLLGGAVRVPSSAPVGPGVSARADVTGAGSYRFGATGLTLAFPADGTLFPNGELCVTRIDHAPHRVPADDVSDSYWIVDNYGPNATFDELESLTFDGPAVTRSHANYPGQIQLRKRASNAHGRTWSAPVDRADAVTVGDPGSVTFSKGNRQTSFSQFILTHELPSERGPAGTEK